MTSASLCLLLILLLTPLLVAGPDDLTPSAHEYERLASGGYMIRKAQTVDISVETSPDSLRKSAEVLGKIGR